MLLCGAFSDVLRAISAPVVELETFRGSVGPWPRAGDLDAPINGCVEGGSEVAVPGATGVKGVGPGVGCDVVEVLRECMGTVVVVAAGAGRV